VVSNKESSKARHISPSTINALFYVRDSLLSVSVTSAHNAKFPATISEADCVIEVTLSSVDSFYSEIIILLSISSVVLPRFLINVAAYLSSIMSNDSLQTSI